MISINVNKDSGFLELKVFGEDFTDTVEFLRDYHCAFDVKKKVWTKPISLLKLLKADLEVRHIEYDISEYDEIAANEYLSSLKELKLSDSRRTLNFDLMKCPPLQGKAPNENYQKQDILRAINQNRFLFNWEMGLGKSYALAVLIEHLRYYKLIDKCLIFSTGVGVFNLKDELLKFGKDFKPEDILVLNSLTEASYEDRDLFNENKYPQNIIIMTYDAFKGINNYYYDKFNATKNNKKPSTKTKYRKSFLPLDQWLDGKSGAIFLDECHSLANPSSRRSEIFKMNLDKFNYRYEFTGTLADKYEKLYMPLFILDKSLVNGCSYNEWLMQYNDLGNRFSRYAINDDKWDIGKLENLNRDLIRNYASKRLMTECLDLPLNYEVPTIHVDMSKEHREIYEGFVKEQLKLIKERENSNSDNVINMFQVFQLSCENIKCIENNRSFFKYSEDLQEKIKKYDFIKDNNKIKVLDSILAEESENGQRGIVWYYHPLSKDYLKEHLAKYDPVIVEAGLKNEELHNTINEFKNNPKHKILIASINVMNTSVTVTEATYNVYFERTFNYTVYSQSRGRIYRPSQKYMCRTYHMTFNDSIDNLQLENLAQKGQIVNALLNKKFIDQGLWKKIFNANEGFTVE